MPRFYTGVGSRGTPAEICALMARIAQELGRQGFVLRSGGADGADSAFEAGADGFPVEIWLPWKGFNGNQSPLTPAPEAFDLAPKYHPAWVRLKRGVRALHARNCHQVLGADLQTPSAFVICWTKDAAGGGGTGQAIRVAKAHHIKVYDLADDITRQMWKAYLRRDEIRAIAKGENINVG